MGKFPFYPQMDSMDCGPACLQMTLQHYGRYYPLPWLRSISYLSREGVSLLGISKAAEKVGLRTMAVKIPFVGGVDDPCLLNAPFPLIAHWNQNHFIAVHKASKKYVWIADPANGKHKLPKADFLRSWQSDGYKGVALLLEPTPAFYEAEAPPSDKLSFRFVLNYLRPYGGAPAYIRCDNGPEFIAGRLKLLAEEHGIELKHILPGKPSQNGLMERLNKTLRVECLDLNWFQSLTELNQRIQDWSVTYNQVRPHNSIGYKSLTSYEILNQDFYFRVVAA